MTGQEVTLHGFLLARIAEDEAMRDVGRVIRAIPAATWDSIPWVQLRQAECKAKRRIVEETVPERDPIHGHPDYDALWVLRLLALPYADHPDYRQEWRRVTPLSPDCENAPYKCKACSGDAWDDDLDQPTPCTCPCHTDEETP